MSNKQPPFDEMTKGGIFVNNSRFIELILFFCFCKPFFDLCDHFLIFLFCDLMFIVLLFNNGTDRHSKNKICNFHKITSLKFNLDFILSFFLFMSIFGKSIGAANCQSKIKRDAAFSGLTPFRPGDNIITCKRRERKSNIQTPSTERERHRLKAVPGRRM